MKFLYLVIIGGRSRCVPEGGGGWGRSRCVPEGADLGVCRRGVGVGADLGVCRRGVGVGADLDVSASTPVHIFDTNHYNIKDIIRDNVIPIKHTISSQP